MAEVSEPWSKEGIITYKKHILDNNELNIKDATKKLEELNLADGTTQPSGMSQTAIAQLQKRFYKQGAISINDPGKFGIYKQKIRAKIEFYQNQTNEINNMPREEKYEEPPEVDARKHAIEADLNALKTGAYTTANSQTQAHLYSMFESIREFMEFATSLGNAYVDMIARCNTNIGNGQSPEEGNEAHARNLQAQFRQLKTLMDKIKSDAAKAHRDTSHHEITNIDSFIVFWLTSNGYSFNGDLRSTIAELFTKLTHKDAALEDILDQTHELLDEKQKLYGNKQLHELDVNGFLTVILIYRDAINNLFRAFGVPEVGVSSALNIIRELQKSIPKPTLGAVIGQDYIIEMHKMFQNELNPHGLSIADINNLFSISLTQSISEIVAKYDGNCNNNKTRIETLESMGVVLAFYRAILKFSKNSPNDLQRISDEGRIKVKELFDKEMNSRSQKLV